MFSAHSCMHAHYERQQKLRGDSKLASSDKWVPPSPHLTPCSRVECAVGKSSTDRKGSWPMVLRKREDSCWERAERWRTECLGGGKRSWNSEWMCTPGMWLRKMWKRQNVKRTRCENGQFEKWLEMRISTFSLHIYNPLLLTSILSLITVIASSSSFWMN